jgi:hypothetical protein
VLSVFYILGFKFMGLTLIIFFFYFFFIFFEQASSSFIAEQNPKGEYNRAKATEQYRITEAEISARRQQQARRPIAVNEAKETPSTKSRNSDLKQLPKG